MQGYFKTIYIDKHYTGQSNLDAKGLKWSDAKKL